jgi:hypothetical protein
MGGTPSTFFNGRSESAGGGPMSASKTKYEQYRRIVEGDLTGPNRASIELDLKRSGDEIRIKASAKVQDAPPGSATESDKKESGDRPRPVLRLALIEKAVRYVGSNKLRFHHHVVRAMPGGPAGKPLADGSCETEVVVRLDELRKELESYVSDLEKQNSFPNPVPKLDLKNLAVAAFVQDDRDKSVWHAVSAPVREPGAQPQ